jgi:hypothetical protein
MATQGAPGQGQQAGQEPGQGLVLSGGGGHGPDHNGTVIKLRAVG